MFIDRLNDDHRVAGLDIDATASTDLDESGAPVAMVDLDADGPLNITTPIDQPMLTVTAAAS